MREMYVENIDLSFEDLRNQLKNSSSLGYARINFHGDPSRILHLSLICLRPYTSIVWHKSSEQKPAFYQVLSGELELVIAEIQDAEAASLYHLSGISNPVKISASRWRRLTNKSKDPVFYLETCLGPHKKNSTLWNQKG